MRRFREAEQRHPIVPVTPWNVGIALINIALPDSRQLPYRGVIQPKPYGYFELQPGQAVDVPLSRRVLSSMTEEGYVRGGIAEYVRGTSLNDEGYVMVRPIPERTGQNMGVTRI